MEVNGHEADLSQNSVSSDTQCLLKFGIAPVILISGKSNGHLGKSEPLLLALSRYKWGFEDVVEECKRQLAVGHHGIEGAFCESMLGRLEASGGLGWAPDLPLPRLKPRGKTLPKVVWQISARRRTWPSLRL